MNQFQRELAHSTKRVSRATKTLVLKRSGHACEMCGSTRDDTDPFMPGAKIRLTVGYISKGLITGLNRPENLRTLCNNCHEGLEGILVPPRPSRIELLTQIRRATIENQVHVLRWLQTKYNKDL